MGRCTSLSVLGLLCAGSFASITTGVPLSSNLFVQLEADVGVVEPALAGDPIVWEDQAPLAGSQNAATSVAGFLPTLVTDASPAGDRPVVRFDGSDFLNIGADSVFESNVFSWISVVRASDIVSQPQWLFGSSYTSLDNGSTTPDNFASNHAWGTFFEAGRFRNFSRSSTGSIRNPFPSGHTATADWFMLTGIWTGDLVKTTVIDSTNTIVAEASVSGASAVPFGHKLSRIGGQPQGGGSGFNGDMAAMLIYDSALTLAQEREVQAYLWDKWFTPIPEPATFLLMGLAVLALRRRG